MYDTLSNAGEKKKKKEEKKIGELVGG